MEWVVKATSRLAYVRYTYCWKVGGLQVRSGHVRKMSPPSGIDSRTA